MSASHPHRRHPHLEVLDGRAAMPQPEANPDVKTVISVVYYTAPKTFDGPAVYITDTVDTSSTTASSNIATTSAETTQSNSDNASSARATAKSTGTTFATETVKASASVSTLSNSSLRSSQAAATATAAAASASATSSASTTSSNKSMSGGAKAGMAFAIICFVALLFFLGFFWRKRRQDQKKAQEQAAVNNEKYNEKGHPPSSSNPFNDPPSAAPLGAMAGMESANSIAKPGAVAFRSPSVKTVTSAGHAPRLSLRPMTQFNPIAAKTELASLDTPVGLGPSTNDPANPFGNHAEHADVVAARDAIELGTPTTPITPALEYPFTTKLTPVSAPRPAPSRLPPTSVPAPSSIVVGNAPKSNPFADHEVPLSPGPAPTGALPAAPVVNGKTFPVHRCHMDFVPSMPDELALKNGQLVRIMHEYDDGWTLCQKMDASSQGVVPRSCLSAYPLKPRPGPGPSSGNRARASSNAPALAQPRPMSPAAGRNSPGPYPRSRAGSNASFAGQPHAMSPLGGRSSPAPGAMPPRNPNTGRHRSQSNTSFSTPRPQFAQEALRPRANSQEAVGRGNASNMNPLAPSSLPDDDLTIESVLPLRKPLPGQAL